GCIRRAAGVRCDPGVGRAACIRCAACVRHRRTTGALTGGERGRREDKGQYRGEELRSAHGSEARYSRKRGLGLSVSLARWPRFIVPQLRYCVDSVPRLLDVLRAMRAAVRLFAVLRERAKRDRIEIEIAGDSATLREVLAKLKEASPEIAPYLPGVRVALNE